MFSIPNPRRKRTWPDGIERFLDGTQVVYGRTKYTRPENALVAEFPKEVRALMKESDEDMLTLHHHADPEVEVYIDRTEIISLVPRWEKLGENA